MRIPVKLWLYWMYFKLAWACLVLSLRSPELGGLRGWFHFMQLPLHLEISPRTAFRDEED